MLVAIILLIVLLILFGKQYIFMSHAFPFAHRYYHHKLAFCETMSIVLTLVTCIVIGGHLLLMADMRHFPITPFFVATLVATGLTLLATFHECHKWEKIARREHPEDRDWRS